MRDNRSKQDIQAITLFTAIEGNNIDVLKKLIKNNVNLLITAKNENNRTPIEHAAQCARESKQWNVVQTIIEYAPENIGSNANFGSALLNLLKYRQFDIARLLLKRIKDVGLGWHNQITGNYPLHYAIINEAPLDIIQLLIKRGADLTKKNKEDLTPVGYAAHCATENNQWNIVQTIIQHVPENVTLNANFGGALLNLLKYHQFDIARLLLKRIRNVNLRCYYKKTGDTALHCAIENSAPADIIVELVRRGANINQPNQENLTPLDFALNKMSIVANYLLEPESFTNNLRSFTEFTTLYLLGISESSVLPPEIILMIADCFNFDNIIMKSVWKKAQDNKNKILHDVIKQKKTKEAPQKYYSSLMKILYPINHIKSIKKQVESCETDQDKSIYIHRLINQFGSTKEGLEAALALLENMQGFYPKELFNKKFYFTLYNTPIHRCKNRINSILDLSLKLANRLNQDKKDNTTYLTQAREVLEDNKDKFTEKQYASYSNKIDKLLKVNENIILEKG